MVGIFYFYHPKSFLHQEKRKVGPLLVGWGWGRQLIRDITSENTARESVPHNWFRLETPYLILLIRKDVMAGIGVGGGEKKLKHHDLFNMVQDLLCII